MSGVQGSSMGSVAAMTAAGTAATAGNTAAASSAAMQMKHAVSAPALAQDEGASAGGFQAIQYGTEIELEFDREVYPIGVSLADASIVGITQRVMRPQQAAAAQVGCVLFLRVFAVGAVHVSTHASKAITADRCLAAFSW